MTPENIAHLRRELKRMHDEWLAEADRAEKNDEYSELCTLCKGIKDVEALYEHLFGVSPLAEKQPYSPTYAWEGKPDSSQDLSDQKIEALFERMFGEPTGEGK